MICPVCAHEKTKVLSTESDTRVIRYRRCLGCNYIFKTIEKLEAKSLTKLNELNMTNPKIGE